MMKNQTGEERVAVNQEIADKGCGKVEIGDRSAPLVEEVPDKVRDRVIIGRVKGDLPGIEINRFPIALILTFNSSLTPRHLQLS